MSIHGATTLAELLESRRATRDSAVISFYSRAERQWNEQLHSEFLGQAQTLAYALERKGLAPGSYVIVAATSPKATLLNFLAAIFAGAIPTILPLRAAFDSKDVIQQRLSAARELLGKETLLVIETVKGKAVCDALDGVPVVYFDAAQELASAEGAFEQRPTSAISHVQLTSGSTGAGKGVAVSHSALLANIDALQDRAGVSSDDVYVSWLPLYHDMGLVSQALMTLALGIDVHFMSPFDFLADPGAWVEAISAKGGTTTASPTFGYDLVTKRVSDDHLKSLDLSSWRIAYCGAEPVRADVMEAFVGRFSTAGLPASCPTPSYGLAEATLGVTAIPAEDQWKWISVSKASLRRLGQIDLVEAEHVDATRAVSLGRPLKGLDVSLKRADGSLIVEDLHCGEVVVSGTSVTSGWLHPGAILEGFPDDGLHTGDIGFWLRGELFVVDRIKNIVIRNGQNYSAQVLEQTLSDAAGVSVDDVVVVDMDIEVGAGLTGVIEIEKKADPSLYFAAIKKDIERFEPPLEAIVFVRRGALPRTTSGKKRHIAVREGLRSGEIRAMVKHDVSLSVQNETSASTLDLEDLELQSIVGSNSLEIESGVTRLVLAQAEARGLDVEVQMSSRLQYDLDFDSLDLLDLAVSAEELFEVELARETVSEIKTVGDLASAVFAARKEVRSGTGGIVNSLNRLKKEVPQYFTVVDDVRPNREIEVNGRWMIDFASCGYLGLEEFPEVTEAVAKAHAKWGLERWSTRAVGMPRPVLDVEKQLADFIGVPDTMVFATITLLHVGVMQVLAGTDGAIIIDSAAHTSMQEAASLARSKGSTLTSFKHEDTADLEAKLQRLGDKSIRIIVLDGVYSMSGSKLNVAKYQALAEKYDAWLYIDDAHGFGVLGENPDDSNAFGFRGNGIVRHCGTSYDRIFYIGGLGKAFSTPMGFISCPTPEFRALFHSAFPVIFGHLSSTAALAQANAVLKLNDELGDDQRSKIANLTAKLVEGAEGIGFTTRGRDSAVINVTIGDVDSLIIATNVLWDDGIKITPAMFPAVPLNEGGLRFTVTASNTESQVDTVLSSLSKIWDKLGRAGHVDITDAARATQQDPTTV